MFVLPQRASCNQRSAILVQHMKAPEQAQENTSPWKMNVTIKSPVGDISVVTLIRTDTTLDHSQKAEKVWVLRFWEMTGDIDTYKCRANTCPFMISFDWKRPSVTSFLYENGLPWPILTSVLTANGFSVTILTENGLLWLASLSFTRQFYILNFVSTKHMTMMWIIWAVGAEAPKKLIQSHWCVPLTATFSKRRKIDALWSERCDARWCWSHHKEAKH